jgi:hypothetical protein
MSPWKTKSLPVHRKERILSATETEIPDRFNVFRETCQAAGVFTSAGRLDVFLALPEPVQDQVFSDVAKRITGRDLVPGLS